MLKFNIFAFYCYISLLCRLYIYFLVMFPALLKLYGPVFYFSTVIYRFIVSLKIIFQYVCKFISVLLQVLMTLCKLKIAKYSFIKFRIDK